MLKTKLKKYSAGGVLASIGFILSPLTWWNDLFINLPLAFGFAYAVGGLMSFAIPVNKAMFLTLMAIGYFLTNLAGFLLMQRGALHFYNGKKVQFSWGKNIFYSLLAIALVVFSIQIGLLDMGEAEKLSASILSVPFVE